jgi:hypothetical protein
MSKNKETDQISRASDQLQTLALRASKITGPEGTSWAGLAGSWRAAPAERDLQGAGGQHQLGGA